MDFHRGILPYKQEDNMSLFRKKKWDIERSEQNNEVHLDVQSEIIIRTSARFCP